MILFFTLLHASLRDTPYQGHLAAFKLRAVLFAGTLPCALVAATAGPTVT
jgi:hypothetical protein